MRPLVGRLVRWIGFTLLVVAILSVSAWCTLAVWFHFAANAAIRNLLAGAMFALTLATVSCLVSSWRWRALCTYALVVAVVFVWWTTIKPSNDRDWAPDVARTATATIDGDRLVIDNVRDFTWRSDTDFDQRWETRIYSLSHVTGVDLIMSYWAGEEIAHTIISFGFQDGSKLAFSIEIRRERHEVYSPLAGFFKQYDIAIIAADENDVVRLRSNVRNEDVRIYHLRMSPAIAQKLLSEYVDEINEIARNPRFYNTLTSNCTTLVFKMVRVIHPGLPIDRRILLSGYLPDYAYDIGALDTSIPFEQLRKLSRIHDKAVQADSDLSFSERIREGIPMPH